MENPRFVDDENISLITLHENDRDGDHDIDYDKYNTRNTTVGETAFATPDFTNKQSILTLLLREKGKQDKPAVFYQLNVTGDLDLINLN